MTSKVMAARRKINEARFHYEKMLGVEDNPEQVSYYLSASLTAARSVREYVKSEIHTNSQLKTWWDQQTIYQEALVGYFDNRRNYEIHLEVNKGKTVMDLVHQNVNITIGEHLHIRESITIQVTRADGTVEAPITYSAPPAPPTPSTTTISRSYLFTDYPSGSVDVFATCHQYLTRLKRLVEEAEKNV